MPAVSVVENNTRVEDAENGLGYSNIGGGQSGSSEGSFPYQGGNLFNRKVSGQGGFYYDPTSDGKPAVNMQLPASRTWMVKAIVTDYGGLNGVNGIQIRIGSGINAFHVFIVSGSAAKIDALSEYPPAGGLIIVPIDPNVAAYRDSTSGSPALGAVDYFGIQANMDNSTSKSENVGLDAIDVGTGLTLEGGDGADTDGTFADFVSFDEGTVNNRFGYATSIKGIVSAFGTLTIGSAAATEFTDNVARVLFPDGLFAAGWSGVAIDIQNAATLVAIGAQLVGLGSSAVEDTRPDYTVTGTAGLHTLTGELTNFRNVTLTSGCIVDGATLQAVSLTQDGADISATLQTTTDAGGAFVANATFGATGIHDTSFIQNGAGHAIEITTPGSYDLSAIFFEGYGADDATDAAIYNNSGGAVTLNIQNGGDVPTIRNGTGATTVVVNAVLVGISVFDAVTELPVANARVLVRATSGGPLATGDVVLDGVTDANGRLETTTFNFTAEQPVSGRVRRATNSPYYKTGPVSGTITAAGFDTNILLISDE